MLSINNHPKLNNNLIVNNNLSGPMETILEVGAEVVVMVIVAMIIIGIIGNRMVVIFMLDTNVTSMIIYQNSVLSERMYSLNPSLSSKQPELLLLILLFYHSLVFLRSMIQLQHVRYVQNLFEHQELLWILVCFLMLTVVM